MAADAVNTNWHCMRKRACINPHDHVLLIGAGGGLGLHGVQVAKCFGARVIAADVSDEKLSAAKQWGADETINVRAVADLAKEVKCLTEQKGVQAAIDLSAMVRRSSLQSTVSPPGGEPSLSAPGGAKLPLIRWLWS